MERFNCHDRDGHSLHRTQREIRQLPQARMYNTFLLSQPPIRLKGTLGTPTNGRPRLLQVPTEVALTVTREVVQQVTPPTDYYAPLKQYLKDKRANHG